MINIQDSFLKKIFLVMLGMSAIIVLALNIYIYPSFEAMIIKETKSKAVTVAKHLSNMIIPDGSELFITHMVQSKSDQIYKFVEEFSIYKLKILGTFLN